jgi:hypothetical protein
MLENIYFWGITFIETWLYAIFKYFWTIGGILDFQIIGNVSFLGDIAYKRTTIEPMNGCKFGGIAIHLSFL